MDFLHERFLPPESLSGHSAHPADFLYLDRLMLSPGIGASTCSIAPVIFRMSVLFRLIAELIAARIDR